MNDKQERVKEDARARGKRQQGQEEGESERKRWLRENSRKWDSRERRGERKEW